MTEYEKLMAQAEILDETARWCCQPDEPTGANGLLSWTDLMLRACALRTQAEVLHR